MNKGFTLIELIVIIAILAILVITAIPKLGDINETRLNVTVRKVAQDMSYVHEYAMNNNCKTRIVFNKSANNYSVYEKSSGAWQFMKDPTTRENFTVQLNKGEYRGVLLKNANFDGKNGIIFDSIGRPYKTEATPLKNEGSVVLKIKVRGGDKTSTIFVAPKTGGVYLKT